MFAFTLFGANIDKSINIGAAPYVFYINGTGAGHCIIFVCSHFV